MVSDSESPLPAEAQREQHEARVRCPRCGQQAAWRGNPHRPFCSLPCRLIDLGLWLEERYRIESDSDESDRPRDVP